MEGVEAPQVTAKPKCCVLHVNSSEEKMMRRLVFSSDKCTGDDCQLPFSSVRISTFGWRHQTRCCLFLSLSAVVFPKRWVVFHPEPLSLDQVGIKGAFMLQMNIFSLG